MDRIIQFIDSKLSKNQKNNKPFLSRLRKIQTSQVDNGENDIVNKSHSKGMTYLVPRKGEKTYRETGE